MKIFGDIFTSDKLLELLLFDIFMLETLEERTEEIIPTKMIVHCGYCDKELEKAKAYESPCGFHYCNEEICFRLFTED
ncbi:MAG: hypothetical protein K8R46_09790 [Pirellulales bacterium]|nr:hypothetical protein [Pirellulales bacterium]